MNVPGQQSRQCWWEAPREAVSAVTPQLLPSSLPWRTVAAVEQSLRAVTWSGGLDGLLRETGALLEVLATAGREWGLSLDLYRLSWKAWGWDLATLLPGCAESSWGHVCGLPAEVVSLGRPCRPTSCSRVKLLTPLQGILTLSTGAWGLQGA